MAEMMVGKWPMRALVTIGSVGTVAVGGLVASRFFGARKVSSAERLAEALLDVERLREAAASLPEASEATLAHCAAYVAGMAFKAAAGIGVAAGTEDRIGSSRTQSHPYTGAVVTVLTEAETPERILTYTLDIPQVGEVRGTRRVGGIRLSNLLPVRPTPDNVQITLQDGYSVQLESELLAADYLSTGKNRLSGSVTFRDNRGNVGRLNIANDGALSGTVTRDAQVVGRFEGKVTQGMQFTPYQIGSVDTGAESD